MERVAAITIDVDSLRCYREIHGLPPRDGPDPVYTVALPRFFELIEKHGARATLFLIGEDAATNTNAFAPARGRGHEIASHSMSHDYRLISRDRDAIERDLASAERALEPIGGGRIRGFRAPGYNVSEALLEILVARGYAYDSSLLPSPLYFAARAAAIGSHRLRGRRSSSLVGRGRAFAGPLAPYRMEPRAPWRRERAGSLLEIPIACEPITRAPLIGTSWAVLPGAARRAALASALRGLGCFNFELHAIDFLDRSDQGVPPELAALQPDLRVPAAKKIAAFSELFAALHQDRAIATLAEIAASAP